MWRRFMRILRCPLCRQTVDLIPFEESVATVDEESIVNAKASAIFDDEFTRYVKAGVIVCQGCRTSYPILDGLPIFVCYQTQAHRMFASQYSERLRSVASKYAFPSEKPQRGEEFVMESFSHEWLAYDYDGVIWGMSYTDHERRLLAELGTKPARGPQALFLELGCGLGISTHLAHKNYGADAIGVDLSTAVRRAANEYSNNPFLHFAQASVFRLPFAHGFADTIYSHGVLHHTFSTREAFQKLASHCKQGGETYIWVYGIESKGGSPLRRLAYVGEEILRPVLSRHSASWLGRAFLGLTALGYMLVNRWHRVRNAEVQPYNFRRAVHAARDRFTPLFAHRHSVEEVSGWFGAVGFREVEHVDWRSMPPADQDNYRRNVGIRAIRTR
jgi:SAM-dependent methyltransferase/uncharacterized protein YbaR (Trm112 family)